MHQCFVTVTHRKRCGAATAIRQKHVLGCSSLLQVLALVLALPTLALTLALVLALALGVAALALALGVALAFVLALALTLRATSFEEEGTCCEDVLGPCSVCLPASPIVVHNPVSKGC